MLKRDYADIVYKAIAEYFDVQVINANLKRLGKNIKVLDVSSSTTVPAGSYEAIQIGPPEGKVWKVINFYFEVQAPSGATTGTHSLSAYTQGHASVISGVQDYNATLKFWCSYFSSAKSADPSSDVAQLLAVQTLVAKVGNPIIVKYSNYTDVDQTKSRYCRIVIEEFDEVS